MRIIIEKQIVYVVKCLNNYLLIYIFRKIKVWNLVAALDPRAPASTLCLRTLMVSVLHYIHFYDLLFFRD